MNNPKTIVNEGMPLLNTFRAINQLECTKRYSQIQLSREENVLEHTGFVVLFITYAWHECRNSKDHVPFDLGKALHRGALHDVDESVTGDVPRTTKYFSDAVRCAMAQVEAAGVKQLASETLNLSNDLSKEFLQIWQQAKDDTTEGYIVKIADLVAVVYRLWVEVILRNNLCILPVAHGVNRYLRAFKREGVHRFFIKDSDLIEYIDSVVDQSLNIVSRILSRDEWMLNTIQQ